MGKVLEAEAEGHQPPGRGWRLGAAGAPNARELEDGERVGLAPWGAQGGSGTGQHRARLAALGGLPVPPSLLGDPVPLPMPQPWLPLEGP